MAGITFITPTKSICVIISLSSTCPDFSTGTSLASFDLVYSLLTEEKFVSEFRDPITCSTKVVGQVLWKSPEEQTT
jgi:hypothetical protein